MSRWHTHCYLYITQHLSLPLLPPSLSHSPSLSFTLALIYPHDIQVDRLLLRLQVDLVDLAVPQSLGLHHLRWLPLVLVVQVGLGVLHLRLSLVVPGLLGGHDLPVDLEDQLDLFLPKFQRNDMIKPWTCMTIAYSKQLATEIYDVRNYYACIEFML